MTTVSHTTSPTASGHVTIVFTSDWGVSTGVGQAGRTHSTIERCGDDPVVRGTVITGVLREQAMLAAKALDGPEEKSPKKWTNFALWLFGQDPDSEPGSPPPPASRSLHGRDPGLENPNPRYGVPLHRPKDGDRARPVPALHGARSGRRPHGHVHAHRRGRGASLRSGDD